MCATGNTENSRCLKNTPPPLRPEACRLDSYLVCSEIIDWRTPAIVASARSIAAEAESDVDRTKRLFEWVRDQVPHSCDAGHETVTCRASDVLHLRTGLCFAKSHLLAAMLRAVDLPAGFCYQLLRYDDGPNARMILHGLNGVYLPSIGQWFRVDPRGNKQGVDAQFRLDCEQLAFPTNTAAGEALDPTVFVEPLPSVVSCLTTSASVQDALKRLPGSVDAFPPAAPSRRPGQ
jgi:hypothetical protein